MEGLRQILERVVALFSSSLAPSETRTCFNRWRFQQSIIGTLWTGFWKIVSAAQAMYRHFHNVFFVAFLAINLQNLALGLSVEPTSMKAAQLCYLASKNMCSGVWRPCFNLQFSDNIEKNLLSDDMQWTVIIILYYTISGQDFCKIRAGHFQIVSQPFYQWGRWRFFSTAVGGF